MSGMTQNAMTDIVEVPADLADLIPAFLTRAQESVQQIPDLLRAESFAEITRIGHNLAGSGSSYGFTEVSCLGRQIESAARSSQTPQVDALAHELLEYLQSVLWRPES